MAKQMGGYEKIPFTSKDLYNRLSHASKVEFIGSNAGRAIRYLEHKADEDPDGRCRSDYETYGHAVAFDSTYKTNSYGKSLLICIGTNNYYRTCILGFAILDNESGNSYKWARRAFMECMGGVLPKTVVTDGDEAIVNMLEELMDDVPHRLCLPNWYSGTTQILRGNFFCGMTTTQRSEGINAMLKKKFNQKLKLYEFMRAINMASSLIRQHEAKDEYITLHTSPELGKTNLSQIKDELANLYTRNMFYKVRHQLLKEGRYMVKTLSEEEDALILKLHKYAAEQVKRHVYVTPERDLFV
ncbi:protein FAR-RED IMPAIRED RESPONSE 1-like [Humulus lupulus]|uniref:protein FAR-RED IMPAIRED RESPONSE 1-like n=1 Tax=Humulus lupulus TaxID=3486 RepID=UPI002B404D16|nr:protein FAR-RED IMPAIRED RESPONSE 1-like [Humulus lupulus]